MRTFRELPRILARGARSQLSDQVAEVKRMLCRLMQSLTPTG